ncbi:nitrate- and nitrite sensing domain-containing protein [Streptomyces sp. NPDC047000]|uniref:sensor histidine kinase n=1 Tax=Streptomyces sp. NPDC047000 TaxID=3155474 RepID=UPI0034069F1B
MQKKRPRRTEKQSAPAGGPEQTPAAPVGKGRPTHVRNRLVVAVAVVAAAVAAAGAPTVLAASQRLNDSQDLVTLAQRTQDALTLAHSLADERDEVTSYIAAGRPKDKAPDEQRGARVDREVEDLRADTDTPAGLRTDLDAIASVRRAALTGKSTALEAHEAYSATIGRLHRLAEDLAEQMPPRAGSGAYSLAELDSAVQQSAAARGLLLAALDVPSTTQTVYNPLTGLPTTTTVSTAADAKQRDALSAAAQQARVRSDAALAGFRENAPQSAVHSYDTTVTGPEADSADSYLTRLTGQPTLSDSELGTSAKKLDAALSARVEMMRGVESSLYDHRTKDLARLRDDDVTALEIRVAALGVLLLVTLGVSTAMARTLTRPLSALRRGSARLAEAADPVAEEPVRFTGRNDEFAQVVRSVNALHAHAAALHERVTTLETDRRHLVGQRQKMADAREDLRTELADAAAQLERLRSSIGGTFVGLALRTLGLVERQLTVIEGLEEREQDPDRLSTLFKLDHFATVMRRHSENLLVLAGSEHVQQSAGPVPLVDVVRAAVSEIERYDRVRIAALPPHAHVAGFAADDLSHLLAELMENATASSPPDLPVEISGWLLESGEVMLSVQDEGIGMAAERMTRLNTRLAGFDPESPYDQEGEEGLGLGLYVVARIAHRHGVRVQLREQKQGGTAVVVVLPQPLLAAAPSAAVPAAGPVNGGTPAFSLPGANAEANGNVLPGRTAAGGGAGPEADGDPLVTLAERAVGSAGETGEAGEADDTGKAGQAREAGEPAATGKAAEAPAGHPEADDEEADDEVDEADEDQEADEDPETAAPATGAGPTRDIPAPAREHTSAPVPMQPAPHAEQAREHAAVPEQRTSETTMELLIPEPAAGPDPSAPGPGLAAGSGAGTVPGPADPDAGPGPGLEDADPAQPADHARTPDATGTTGTTKHALAVEDTDGLDEPGEAGEAEEADEVVTAKGLPKRTPNITAPTQAPGPRTRSVDAEALRRKLGGFRQGADAGRRDVAAEIAEQTGQNRRPADRSAERTAEEATGGTVEEASS